MDLEYAVGVEVRKQYRKLVFMASAIHISTANIISMGWSIYYN